MPAGVTIQGREAHKLTEVYEITKDTVFTVSVPLGSGRHRMRKFSGQGMLDLMTENFAEISGGAHAFALNSTETYFYPSFTNQGDVAVGDLFGSFTPLRDYTVEAIDAYAENAPNGTDGEMRLEIYDFNADTALSTEKLIFTTDIRHANKQYSDTVILQTGNRYGIRVANITTAATVTDLEVNLHLRIFNQSNPNALININSLATAKQTKTDRDPEITDDETKGYDLLSTWLNTDSKEIFTCVDPVAGLAEWKQITNNPAPSVALSAL